MKRGHLKVSASRQTTTNKFHNVHAQTVSFFTYLVRNAATTNPGYASVTVLQQQTNLVCRNIENIFAWVKYKYMDVYIPKLQMGPEPSIPTTFNMADLDTVPPTNIPDPNAMANYWRAVRNYWAYIVVPKKWQNQNFWNLVQSTRVNDYTTMFNVVAKWQPFREELRIRLRPYVYMQTGGSIFTGGNATKEIPIQGFWIPAPKMQTDDATAMTALLQFGCICMPFIEDTKGGELNNLLTSGMNIQLKFQTWSHVDMWKLSGTDQNGQIQGGELQLVEDEPDYLPPDDQIPPTFIPSTTNTVNPHPIPTN